MAIEEEKQSSSVHADEDGEKQLEKENELKAQNDNDVIMAQVPEKQDDENADKAPVPPSEENVEKALEPEKTEVDVNVDKETVNISSQSVPDGNATQSEPINIDGNSQLPPIGEDVAAPEKEIPMTVEEEMLHPNPGEKYPVFLIRNGVRGPPFNLAKHHEKLAFFKSSPYDEARTADSPRFWTLEKAVYYARIVCHEDRIYPHGYLDIEMMKKLDCFKEILRTIDDLCLEKVFTFNHGWIFSSSVPHYMSQEIRWILTPGLSNG